VHASALADALCHPRDSGKLRLCRREHRREGTALRHQLPVLLAQTGNLRLRSGDAGAQRLCVRGSLLLIRGVAGCQRCKRGLTLRHGLRDRAAGALGSALHLAAQRGCLRLQAGYLRLQSPLTVACLLRRRLVAARRSLELPMQGGGLRGRPEQSGRGAPSLRKEQHGLTGGVTI
jgi:hypothetical protein